MFLVASVFVSLLFCLLQHLDSDFPKLQCEVEINLGPDMVRENPLETRNRISFAKKEKRRKLISYYSLFRKSDLVLCQFL